MINELKLTIKTSPLKTIFILIFGWIIMILLNYFLNENGFFTGTRITFPISVVYFSKFTPLGILFSFVFLFSGLYILNRYKNLNTKQLIISYIVLIILGNLAQGSIHQTFYRSFIDTDFQYYHDAISIKNGFEFISNYNQIQDSLTMHAKTHPPFTVWIHYIFLKVTNNSVLGLAILLSSIGLFTIVPLIKILNIFSTEKSTRNILILIFALIPAVNIYSIVSIDSNFLCYTLIFLYGLLKINQENKISLQGIILATLGFTLANFISFSGTFLAAFTFFYCAYKFFSEKKTFPLINFIFVAIIFLFILAITNFTLDYNHIQAFFQASKSENPNGFRGFHQPLVYLFTRIEDISEILLFLSFGFFAYLFSPRVFNIDSSKIYFKLSIIAFATLFLMFLTGAYGTGETARACLYIYPFFLFLLIDIKNIQILKNIAYIALFQTFIMQLIGDYFW